MGPEAPALVFDALMALLLVVLAAMSVLGRDLLCAIAAFMALGLVLAITWARLGAVDVALAEAVLGAGVLGGLLLRAWAAYGEPQARSDGTADPATRAGTLLAAVLAVAVAAAAGVAALSVESEAAATGEAVAGVIHRTGVSHPVTAVLLDFRSLDTLLELAVLLAAVTAALSVARVQAAPRRPGHALAALLRVVIPALVLLAGVLLWRGAYAPGGAFQAGATLGAAGILALLGYGAVRLKPGLLSAGLAAGVSVFTAAAVTALTISGRLLDWPDAVAGSVILAIETAATLSVALALVALFAGGTPVAEHPATGHVEGRP